MKFSKDDAVEIIRDPSRDTSADWIRGTYVGPSKHYQGWHWVMVAFGEKVHVPTRRIRRALAL